MQHEPGNADSFPKPKYVVDYRLIEDPAGNRTLRFATYIFAKHFLGLDFSHINRDLPSGCVLQLIDYLGNLIWDPSALERISLHEITSCESGGVCFSPGSHAESLHALDPASRTDLSQEAICYYRVQRDRTLVARAAMLPYVLNMLEYTQDKSCIFLDLAGLQNTNSVIEPGKGADTGISGRVLGDILIRDFVISILHRILQKTKGIESNEATPVNHINLNDLVKLWKKGIVQLIRLGGDEFVILVDNNIFPEASNYFSRNDIDNALQWVKRLVRVGDDVYFIGGYVKYLSNLQTSKEQRQSTPAKESSFDLANMNEHELRALALKSPYSHTALLVVSVLNKSNPQAARKILTVAQKVILSSMPNIMSSYPSATIYGQVNSFLIAASISNQKNKKPGHLIGMDVFGLLKTINDSEGKLKGDEFIATQVTWVLQALEEEMLLKNEQRFLYVDGGTVYVWIPPEYSRNQVDLIVKSILAKIPKEYVVNSRTVIPVIAGCAAEEWSEEINPLIPLINQLERLDPEFGFVKDIIRLRHFEQFLVHIKSLDPNGTSDIVYKYLGEKLNPYDRKRGRRYLQLIGFTIDEIIDTISPLYEQLRKTADVQLYGKKPVEFVLPIGASIESLNGLPSDTTIDISTSTPRLSPINYRTFLTLLHDKICKKEGRD